MSIPCLGDHPDLHYSLHSFPTRRSSDLIALIIKVEHDKTKAQKKLMYRLNKEWGDVPKGEFTSEKLESLIAYYESIKREDGDVDDITWHDLDMNQIFMTINNTCSAAGEEVLYALLHQPEFNQDKLSERHRLIEFFRTNKEKRQIGRAHV